MVDFEHTATLKQAMEDYISGSRQDIAPVLEAFRNSDEEEGDLIIGGHRDPFGDFVPALDPISGREYLTVFTEARALHYCQLEGILVSAREILDFLKECPDVVQGIVLNARQEAVILPLELLLDLP